MQSVLSRIWTRVAVFISYNDNHYKHALSIDKYSYISVYNKLLSIYSYLVIVLVYKYTKQTDMCTQALTK